VPSSLHHLRCDFRGCLISQPVTHPLSRVSQILEEQQELAFHLQQQRLIELIREGRVDDALEFAQENLAPLGEEQPALLEELGAP